MQKKEPEAPALEVKHFYYTVWPDHGVPQYATSLIKFIRRVRKFQSAKAESTAPIVVHCRYVCMYVRVCVCAYGLNKRSLCKLARL